MLTTLDRTGRVEWLEVPKGCLAFMRTLHSGYLPCRIEHLRRVTFPDCVELWADVVFTATRGYHKRGAREARDLGHFVPRSALHRSRQRPGFFVVWAFDWADHIPALKGV
jgi:hypothetical protein